MSVLLLSTTMSACAAKGATAPPMLPSKGPSRDAVAPSPSGQPGAAVVFDSKGADFGPWLRQFIPRLKSHWFLPYALTAYTGHVVVTFRVAKDGSIHDLALKEPSSVTGFNKAAMEAVRGVQKAPPLPVRFRPQYATFTITFFYNEKPAG